MRVENNQRRQMAMMFIAGACLYRQHDSVSVHLHNLDELSDLFLDRSDHGLGWDELPAHDR